MANISNETMDLLLNIQSPKFKNILKEYISTGYNDYTQNTHSTGEQNIAGLEQFCKLIYTDWYNRLTKNNAKLTGTYKLVSDALLQYDMFKPENVEKQKSATPFYNFFLRAYDKYFKGTGTRPAKLQVGKGLIQDENEGIDGDDFLHVFGYEITEKQRQKEDARLYLNLKAKNIPLFAIEAYTKCKELQLPFYFKFGLQDNRNDPFLFYTSYEDLPKYVAVIEEIKREKPELFEDTALISKNLGVLNGYIGYGEEPLIKDESGDNYSYNSLRKECVNRIRRQIIKDTAQKFLQNSHINAFTMKPWPMTFDDCCDRLLQNYMSQHLKTNAPAEKLSYVESCMKEKFRQEIKRSILSGKPVGDILINFGEYRGELKTSRVDWIDELYKKSEVQLDEDNRPLTRTAFRGYLTKFTVFSGPKLNEDEQKLITTIRKKLIEGLHSDLDSSTISIEEKQIVQKYLDKIDVPFDKINATAKGLLLLSSANFIENNALTIQGTGAGFTYPELMLDVYEEILGKDHIEKTINDICDKKHVSTDNMCFNTETELQILDAKLKQLSNRTEELTL